MTSATAGATIEYRWQQGEPSPVVDSGRGRMVVQSIALPKVSGGQRDHELAAAPVEIAAAPAVGRRSFHAPILVPLLVASQVAWLALIGYGVLRVLH